MKYLSSMALVGTLAFCQLIAGEQEFKVTTATLAGWDVSGGPFPASKKSTGFVLPAGAQLTRTFSGRAVLVHTTSRPYFGENEASWPILVVGPVALVFKQNNGNGQLLSLGSDGTEQPVLADVPLDESGHSIQPLDLELAFDPANGKSILAVADQTKAYHFSASTAPVDVVISAGTESSWSHDELTVLLVTDDRRATPANDSSSRPSGSQVGNDQRKDASPEVKTSFSGSISAANSTLAAEKNGASTTPVIALEVFSPAAIRVAVSAKARTAAAGTVSK